ncbi:Nephrocystin-3 [Auxenochlorella protothecoides]|uniref:Nephrocystin-3 n=1 Tax=Auxenochlorella protothecoides TaxID=3075 RepID=A0A087SLI0_AUXPR|nr:Nephrocystin-3 [Auxenochlorella protothecoides]KFM26584.1 Nephrocystin-3 [Auxenochlorella protothecoides]
MAEIIPFSVIHCTSEIASKVEIRVAEDAAAPAWRSLGFLSFSPNDRSGHAAREMKSVALPGPPAHLVQLIFHGWHPNALNAHGQVGLVSLAVSGEALPGQPPPSPARSPVVKRGAPGTPPRAAPGESRLPPPPGIHGGAVGPPAAREAQSTPTRLATGFAGGAPAAARPARPQIAADPCSPSRADSTGTQARTLAVGRRTPDARVDPVTAAQIDTLQRQKAAAVEAEDYDEAKRLKSAIDRLCSLGARIAGLEARKAAAVAAEDYDLAKEIKAEVERMSRERAAETSLGDEGSSGDLGPGSSGARPAPGERGDGEGRTSASTLWAEHPPPPGFPVDLPLPEPLSAAAAKDADELWLEAGAGRAPGLLADPDNFGLLARTLSAALHDRVAAAYLAALPALLLLAQCQGLPRGRVVSGLTDAVAVLVEKSGDLNARVAEASTGTLLALALCAFLAPALGHTAGEVRSAAVDLCVLVGEVAGPGIFAHLLPSNLNPKLREAVLSGGNATSPSRRASTQTEAARDGARASPAMPAGGRRGPPEPGGTASPLGSEASSPSIRAGGADDDDAALFAAELAAREARLGPAHPEVADALSNLAIRGETSLALPLYQRALRIWEGALGPDHPEVAHALTDIAVIFLERGEDAKGRPLLARALAIQELELGPAHPDVVAIREVLEESAAA